MLQILRRTAEEDWPHHIKGTAKCIKPYWNFKTGIYVVNDIVFLNERVIIPKSLRQEMLQLPHASHLRISKSKSRANQCMYWPKMTLNMCAWSVQHATNFKERIRKNHWNNTLYDNYVLLVDYYLHFVEIRRLLSKSTRTVKSSLLAISVHSQLEEVIADNKPFNNREFK